MASSVKRSPWFLFAAFAGGILALFIGISFAQELQRRVLLEKQVEHLQAEIHDREQRISGLKELTEYLGTDAYRERAAREKLNFQKPGEKVVVVPRNPSSRIGVAGDDESPPPEPISVPRQWWNLIFAPHDQ